MTFNYIKEQIAERVEAYKLEDITPDFPIGDGEKMDEEEFFLLLEKLENETKIKLVDSAWKFETVQELVDFINDKN